MLTPEMIAQAITTLSSMPISLRVVLRFPNGQWILPKLLIMANTYAFL
jgi:hypothetical protein